MLTIILITFGLGLCAQNDHIDTFYVVIIDQSYDYYELESLMNEISEAKDWEIELGERFYDEDEMYIRLPYDHEDELYAGYYYPRRFPSVALSIEYAWMYEDQYEWNEGGEKAMMSLIPGIYETQAEAQVHLDLLEDVAPKAFIVEAEIYVGCIH